MSKKTLAAIASIGKNRELGKGNDLLWRIPADLQRVKELTTGNTIIMGRKTYESIGRPLPNRQNIVLTRDTNYQAPGCTVATTPEDALTTATGETVYVFGGAAIYKLFMPQIEKLFLTRIDATNPDADAFFPPFEDQFKIVKEYPPTEHAGVSYQWIDYVRKTNRD